MIIQDYTPRIFSFSFGFYCDQINSGSSLKGLSYAIIIYVTNKTNCYVIPHDNECYRYIQYGQSFNLFGTTKKFYLKLLESTSSCYQHARKFLCYVWEMKCNSTSNQIMVPCLEMCYDHMSACGTQMGNWKFINCDYLPSLNGDIPCLYEPVRCMRYPPTVDNATLLNHFTMRDKHSLPTIAEYTCNDGLVGRKQNQYMYVQWTLVDTSSVFSCTNHYN